MSDQSPAALLRVFQSSLRDMQDAVKTHTDLREHLQEYLRERAAETQAERTRIEDLIEQAKVREQEARNAASAAQAKVNALFARVERGELVIEDDVPLGTSEADAVIEQAGEVADQQQAIQDRLRT